MRRAIKLATSMGAASLIVAASATAGTPVAVKGWTTGASANIVFSATCPTNFSCSDVASGPGFHQRKLYYLGTGIAASGTQAAVATGDSFYQTIVTDSGASAYNKDPNAGNWTTNALEFFDESFIKAGNATASGIAGLQHIEKANPTQGNFAINTAMNRNGWANNNATPNYDSMVITTLLDNGPAFNQTNTIRLGDSGFVDQALDFRQNGSMDIWAYRKASGVYSTLTSTVQLPAAPGYAGDTMSVSSGQVASMVYIASAQGGNFKHTGYATGFGGLGGDPSLANVMARTSVGDVPSIELDLYPAYSPITTTPAPPGTFIYAWGNQFLTAPFDVGVFSWDAYGGIDAPDFWAPDVP